MASFIDKLSSTARERGLLSAPDEWGFLCGIKISGELHRLGRLAVGVAPHRGDFLGLEDYCKFHTQYFNSSHYTMTSEQGTAVCAVSDDRKQTTYTFVSWGVVGKPEVIHFIRHAEPHGD